MTFEFDVTSRKLQLKKSLVHAIILIVSINTNKILWHQAYKIFSHIITMKFCNTALFLSSQIFGSYAFSFSISSSFKSPVDSTAYVSLPNYALVSNRSSRVTLSMESDFASAMPEKPSTSLKEQLIESATGFIADIENRLRECIINS